MIEIMMSSDTYTHATWHVSNDIPAKDIASHITKLSIIRYIILSITPFIILYIILSSPTSQATPPLPIAPHHSKATSQHRYQPMVQCQRLPLMLRGGAEMLLQCLACQQQRHPPQGSGQ